MTQDAVIIIPARYGSTRFEGKPLVHLRGRPMLSHVLDTARRAAPNVPVLVATDDDRIVAQAQRDGAQAIMTPVDLPSGTDRVLYALRSLPTAPDIVLNLQGDAPLMPSHAIAGVLSALQDDPSVQVATPYKRLNWGELDKLRESKKTTPFSGTTITIAGNGNAFWFSKNILPAVRKEKRDDPLSPICQHLGLYGYRRAALEKYVTLPEGYYEKLEGLEQLRWLENGIPVRCVELSSDTRIHGGIDTPEDLQRVESDLSW